MKKDVKSFYHSMLAAIALVIASLALTSAHAAETPAATAEPAVTSDKGEGDLLIAPTRVVLEGRDKATDIMLSNKGSKEATYRISFTHLRMQPTGSYTEITEEEAKNTIKSADDLIRYSPRQVTLKPGETQIVKIMVRKPEGLADGEYTSHMLFRAVPDLTTGEDVETSKVKDDKISVRLIPVYGVSIPIIVRQGELTAQAKLEDIKVSANSFAANIHRTGNKSVFGDVIVSKSGTQEVVGQLRGIGVLSYADKRQVAFELKPYTGPLTVEYRERAEDGGKTLDKQEIK